MLSAQKPSETVPAESVPDALTPIEEPLLPEEASQPTISKCKKTQAQQPKQEELLQQPLTKKKQKKQRSLQAKEINKLHCCSLKANPLLL